MNNLAKVKFHHVKSGRWDPSYARVRVREAETRACVTHKRPRMSNLPCKPEGGGGSCVVNRALNGYPFRMSELQAHMHRCCKLLILKDLGADGCKTPVFMRGFTLYRYMHAATGKRRRKSEKCPQVRLSKNRLTLLFSKTCAVFHSHRPGKKKRFRNRWSLTAHCPIWPLSGVMLAVQPVGKSLCGNGCD